MRSVFKAIKQKIPGSNKLSIKANPQSHQQNDSKSRNRYEQSSPISPSALIELKPEYYILDLTVELKDLTNGYEYALPDPFSSPVRAPTRKLSHSSSFNDKNNMNETSESINDEIEKRRKAIENKMYSTLCSLNELVCKELVLEQYVLRELRHLQEFLAHRYPPIAAFLKIPFEEAIQNVRNRTKGLSLLDSFSPSEMKSNILSPPTPRKKEPKTKNNKKDAEEEEEDNDDNDDDDEPIQSSKRVNKNTSRQRQSSCDSNPASTKTASTAMTISSSSSMGDTSDGSRQAEEYGFYDEAFE